VEPLIRGLQPPDPHSLCPLYSTEFVEPPLKKFLGKPMVYRLYHCEQHEIQKCFCIAMNTEGEEVKWASTSAEEYDRCS
jgi:hypothetical protein